MEDHRSAEGVEHLQAAARELLLAARSFLNVVEEVVEDRDRFAGAAAGVVDLLRDGLSGALPPTSPLQPWERAAWGDATTGPDPLDDDTPDHAEDEDPMASTDAAPVDLDAGADDVAAAPVADAPGPAPTRTARKAPARKAAPRKAAAGGEGPPRRVRRIAVD